MNRISIRGVGFAAVSLVATVAVWGGLVPASAQSTQSSALPASSAALLTLYNAKVDGSAAELARLHEVRLWAVQAVNAREAASVRASKVAAANASGSIRALGQQLAAARGWTGVQFACLDAIWTRESDWSLTASNSTSGAYGIPQAQPGSRMGAVGSDWRINPTTQIEWGLSYIAGVYGSPCSAWAFWQSHWWY